MAESGPSFTIARQSSPHRPVDERVKDYREVAVPRDDTDNARQSLRCLDCGVPFCQWSCPLGNDIPDWNGHMAAGRWESAYRALQATNNLPEVTGRVCPAFCESGCVLGQYWDAVTVRENELAVIEHAFRAGYVQPRPPTRRTGRSIAIVGSGPAGLACADQLNQAGHHVVVFEQDPRIGGLLRYGIPDFKLDKSILDRRLAVWRQEGIEFVTGTCVGRDAPADALLREFDAVCLTIGSRVPRDLPIEGRNLAGIHFAMEYLTQANRLIAGDPVQLEPRIDARGKQVVVLGGGDTGADCVGTALRQGAARVVQLELLVKPPEQRPAWDRWPHPPVTLKTSTSHEEGGVREWSVLTKRFIGQRPPQEETVPRPGGQRGAVAKLSCVRIQPIPISRTPRPFTITEIPGTEFELPADLVLLALGFVAAEPGRVVTRPLASATEPKGLLDALGVSRSPRGTIDTDAQYRTTVDKVFSAGDARRGQSLVVHAIGEGRRAAHHIDRFLMGRSALPLM